MYTDYYQFKKSPFQISTDPAFLWLGEKHREALAVLRYGVMDNRGFLLLTGDVGTGKTTLIHALLESLDEKVLVTTVPDPGMIRMDFYNYIAQGFGLNRYFASKGRFLSMFREFLLQKAEAGYQTLLIVDEAQRLSSDMLEEIRLLSNIEVPEKKLLNIFFVGQVEFHQMLLSHENRALRQRITIRYQIDPLSPGEVGDYIRHRLTTVGGAADLFSPNAIKAVAGFSEGFPRLINILCDHALLTGYVQKAKTISADMVKECAKELAIEAEREIGKKKETPPTIEKAMLVSNVPEATADAAISTELPAESSRKRWWPAILLALAAAMVLLYFAYSGMGGRFFEGYFRGAAVSKDKAPPSQEAPVGEIETVQNSGNTVRVTLPVQPPPPPAAPQAALEKAPAESLPDIRNVAVYFPVNSNTIDPDAYRQMELLVETFKGIPDATVTVTGFSDGRGDPGYNQRLSEFRANIIEGYLVGKGIPPERITTRGMGTDPVRGGDARMKRRVEVEVREKR